MGRASWDSGRKCSCWWWRAVRLQPEAQAGLCARAAAHPAVHQGGAGAPAPGGYATTQSLMCEAACQPRCVSGDTGARFFGARGTVIMSLSALVSGLGSGCYVLNPNPNPKQTLTNPNKPYLDQNPDLRVARAGAAAGGEGVVLPRHTPHVWPHRAAAQWGRRPGHLPPGARLVWLVFYFFHLLPLCCSSACLPHADVVQFPCVSGGEACESRLVPSA